jgi:hypothetical protein
VTVFVVLAICAVVFLILARPFRQPAPPPASSPQGASNQSSEHVATRARGRVEREKSVGRDERERLLDEKDRLLQALADLRFDYEAGKLSREDFEEEDVRLRARAAAVLRRLEAP